MNTYTYFFEDTEIGKMAMRVGEETKTVAIVEKKNEARCAYKESGKYYAICDEEVVDSIEAVFGLNHMMEDLNSRGIAGYETFSTFNVRAYMPDTDDSEFFDLLATCMERIKTNYPYANCDFAKVRLPRLRKASIFEESENLTAGYFDTTNNEIAFSNVLDIDGEDNTYIHELIHLSSSFAKEDEVEEYEERGYNQRCGFVDPWGNGICINEGMAETLTEDITGIEGTYYLQRRLVSQLLALAPDKETFIKQFFANDINALSFIGSKQRIHKFIQTSDLLHFLDEDLYQEFDRQVGDVTEQMEVVYANEHDIDVNEVLDEEKSDLEIGAYKIVESSFAYEFESVDFLPNCELILLDTLRDRLNEIEDKEEKDTLIKNLINSMIFYHEVDEVQRLEGYYALNPRFIDMEQMEKVDEKFFEVCIECGYSDEEIESIYEEVTRTKKTVVQDREEQGFFNDPIDFDEEEYAIEIEED